MCTKPGLGLFKTEGAAGQDWLQEQGNISEENTAIVDSKFIKHKPWFESEKLKSFKL